MDLLVKMVQKNSENWAIRNSNDSTVDFQYFFRIEAFE